ncbi:MAG: serine/threonine protein kinase [Magnetospirillum sp.]|nr:serine/threonine protein kinase [Magnetospirillum sp.]
MSLVHGTSVAIGGRALLIRGPSGSGKSDLALRLIDGGALLVADDQTELSLPAEGGLCVSSPASIAGLLEVRGIGLVRMPHGSATPLALVIDLVAQSEVERLPEPDSVELLGQKVNRLHLAPFEASAAAKVRLAMRSPTRDIMRS